MFRNLEVQRMYVRPESIYPKMYDGLSQFLQFSRILMEAPFFAPFQTGRGAHPSY
jgi:hypothetical protein